MASGVSLALARGLALADCWMSIYTESGMPFTCAVFSPRGWSLTLVKGRCRQWAIAVNQL